MFHNIGPRPTDKTSSTSGQQPVDDDSTARGRTSDYRDVSVVPTDGFQLTGQNETRQQRLVQRQLDHSTSQTAFVKTGSNPRASVLWQPSPRPAVHPQTRPLSETQCAGLPKSKFIDRILAVIVSVVLDMRVVKQKFVSYTSATAHTIKGQLQKVRQLMKLGSNSLTKDEKAHSRRLVKSLRKDVQSARQARMDEIHNCIQLFKALKKINRGKIASHQVHFPGMKLAGGKASLENVNMTIKGVDVVSSTSGALVPRIKADVKATLVVPVPGKAPLRVSVDVSGAEVTLEGRAMPFLNSYIQGNSVKNLFRNIRHIRQNKKAMFQMHHVGLSAEKISARLDDIDPGAISRIAARSIYGKRRLIERLMTNVKVPMDFHLGELEVFDGDHQQPVLQMDDVSGQLRGREPDTIRDGEDERRQFLLQTGSIHVDTGQASDIAAKTLQKMMPVPMTVMPGEQSVNSTLPELLGKHSSRFVLDAERSEINFNMDCHYQNGICKPKGTEELDVWVDQLEATNEGATTLDIGAGEVHLNVKRDGADREVKARLHDFIADVDVQEELLDKEIKLDVHGRLQGLDGEVSMTRKDGKTDYHCKMEQVDVRTTSQPTVVSKGNTQITLPARAAVSLDAMTLDSQQKTDKRVGSVRVNQVKGTGNGDVQIKTPGKEWTVPVKGTVSVNDLELDTQQQTTGTQDVPETQTYAQLKKLALNDLGLAGVRLGEVTAELDEQGTGVIRLDKVALDGNELLKNKDLLPEQYRSWLTPALVQGRIFRCNISLPVLNGEIVSDQAAVTGLDIQHTDESSKTWSGWAAGYALAMIQGLVNRLDVSDINVCDGRLWLELNLKGWKLPVPLFKVSNEQVNDKGRVSVTGLLHQNTGVQHADLRDSYKELLAKVNTGQKGSLLMLEQTCQIAQRQEAVSILQRVDIDSILAHARAGNNLAKQHVSGLYRLFRQYPETANRALLATEFATLSAEDLAMFRTEPLRRQVDSVLLFQCLQSKGELEQAEAVMEQALLQTPHNPRLNYYAARLLTDRLNSPDVVAKGEEVISHMQARAASLLARASRGGYHKANEWMKARAKENDKFSALAECGETLTTTKDVQEFFRVMTQLEQLSTVARKDISDCARQMMVNRAKNADCMFLHPDLDQVKPLEKQYKLISSGKEDELLPIDAYGWGLRFLYGIDGIGVNTDQAMHLLGLSEKNGIQAAHLHQQVCNTVHSIPVTAAAAAA